MDTPERVPSSPDGSHLPAPFWDNLSKVWLTENALWELSQRNRKTRLSPGPVTRTSVTKRKKGQQNPQHPAEFLNCCTPQRLRDLRRFARLGGPDLSDLRGYWKPDFPAMAPRNSKYKVQKRGLSTSRASSTSRGTEQSITATTKISSPYDRNFQQHLIDHGIYPPAYEYPDGRVPPKPSNWDDIKKRLSRRRASLTPSKFTEEEHVKFVKADAHAFKERQITESVIRMIEGENGDARCVAGGIPFRNLDHLTDGTLVSGNPDRYHGACPEQLDRRVRNELNGHIVPSSQHDLPILPNFFLAAKGPDGSAAVAKRQASYDGALGARGIHSLQTYGDEEPGFDNNAYTISSIYHDGTLKIFTSHLAKPAALDRPECYTTQLRSFALTDTVEIFREGVTWYRNARDWAKEQRNNAIKQANKQVS